MWKLKMKIMLSFVLMRLTLLLKSGRNKRNTKKTMPKDGSIPVNYKEIIDLDETHLNNKMRKYNVVYDEETIVSFEYHGEICKGGREMITLMLIYRMVLST